MKENKISIDISGITSFATDEALKAFTSDAVRQSALLQEGKGQGNDFLGWMSLPDSAENILPQIKECAARLRQQADITVVVGIGGSYLGAKAVMEAMANPFDKDSSHRVIFAGHTLSEDYHSSLLGFLGRSKFNIVVISKSGTTTEPAIAFRILRERLSVNVGAKSFSDHIVAITDARRGALRNLAVREGFQTFVIPDDVGGRYSVLTPVGLLPVALAGLDVDSFVKGMKDMALNVRKQDGNTPDISVIYAAARNLLYTKGYSNEILVSYEPALLYVAEWWKQLFGESEGKEGKGIFPASVNFTTDLHSMGQYIQEGERKLFETMISVKGSRGRLQVPRAGDDADGIGFIAGMRMSEVNHKAESGTRLAHIEGGVPVISLNLPEINEYYLGQLMFFFEMSCAISGYVLGVNPFDQPGVESYKKNMFALLGKPGYETEKERLENLMKTNK